MSAPSRAATRRGLRPAARPLAVLIAIVAAAALAACGEPATTAAQPTVAATESPSTAAVSDPALIRIPAIDVEATLVDLGLQADGAMEVPDFGLAGWYTEGPRPGEIGPAVVAAHVDSKQGPDVFFRLRELVAGDQVTVTDHAGQDHTFTVQRVEQHDKDALPAGAIWGATAGPTLRLITCGGSFDAASGHYRDNIIVYASAQ